MLAKKRTAIGKSMEQFESIIGATLRIDGNLNVSQCLRIDGVVNGNIFQEEGAEATVAVAQGAVITGDIRAKQVIISGEVNGNIFSNDRVELLSTAIVKGNIRYGSIGLEMGARISGNLNQIDHSEGLFESSAVIEQVKQKSFSQ